MGAILAGTNQRSFPKKTFGLMLFWLYQRIKGRAVRYQISPRQSAPRQLPDSSTKVTMATLVTLQGPNPGRQFPLGEGSSLIGRQPNSTVHLDSLAVSRQHARILRSDENFFLEDLNSSNGTYLNGQRIIGRVPLTERDTLQIGPYVLALRCTPAPTVKEPDPIIRSRVDASAANSTLFQHNPAYKLQVIMEITQHLARTLEFEPLLGKLLEHLLRLFPQADRGLVVLYEQDRLVLRSFRCRRSDATDAPFSRSVVQRASR